MGSSIIGSALSAMNAAQLGMSTVQHNIANAQTAGYSRQQTDVSSRAGQATTNGFIGKGVDVTSVRRVYDDFLTTQVMQDQSRYSYLDTFHSALSRLDNIVADQTSGVTPALQEFFASMNSVANNPESVTARQTLLGSAQFVANRMQAINQRFTDISNEVNKQISSSVDLINGYAKQIQQLNSNIKTAMASLPGKAPNDLLDQRNQVLLELNKEIKVRVDDQGDGVINLYIGQGQSLLVSNQLTELRAVDSVDDPSRVEIALSNGFSNQRVPTRALEGGNLTAYLNFRDSNLEDARNALGRVALGVADSLNQQNRKGLDLNGNVGGNLFTMGAPQLIDNTLNSGDAVFSSTIGDVGALTASDYQLYFDGTNHQLRRLSDNFTVALTSGFPATMDGFTINLDSGSMQEGDSLLIRPTANGARDLNVVSNDPALIAAAAPIRANANLTNLGTATVTPGRVIADLPLPGDLRTPVNIEFINATTYVLTDPASGNSLTSNTTYDPAVGATIQFNGWEVRLSGAPRTGDVFTVRDNAHARGDNRNALLLADLQRKPILAGETQTLQSTYAQLVGQIGAKTHELDLTGRAQQNMLSQSVTAQQSVSGVNLDEEAASLVQYQQAYQAAAKAMAVANKMFDTLLEII